MGLYEHFALCRSAVPKYYVSPKNTRVIGDSERHYHHIAVDKKLILTGPYMKNHIMTSIIPLKYLLLDRAMSTWVKTHANSHAKALKMKKLHTGYDDTVGGLNQERIDSLKQMECIDPIRITPYRNSNYYEVIDGRHRTVLAISREQTIIVALVKKSTC